METNNSDTFVTPTFHLLLEQYQQQILIQNNWTFNNIESAVLGLLQGRRPNFNLQFPRGYYNK